MSNTLALPVRTETAVFPESATLAGNSVSVGFADGTKFAQTTLVDKTGALGTEPIVITTLSEGDGAPIEPPLEADRYPFTSLVKESLGTLMLAHFEQHGTLPPGFGH